MRNATIEAEVREEAAQEMQEALKQMHTDFAKLFQDQVGPSFWGPDQADNQVEASENKTDRKLDILSRTIPTPGPMRRREDTPDGDTSMEQSFESAEQSLSVPEDAAFDHGSDPFLMPSKPRQHATERNEEDGSDTASEDEDEDENDEEAVNATLSPRHRRDTVRPTPALADVSMESEDPLAAMDHLNVSRDEAGSSDLTDEEGISGDDDEEEDDEEDDEEESQDEEEEELEEDDEEVADDEDEGEAGESSFATSTAASDTASNSDSDSDSDVYSDRGRGGRDSDESAVGRGATQRRKSGSPIKKSRPSLPSSSKSKPKPKSTTVRAPKKVNSPLQERRAQDVIEISDDEVVAVKTPQKKRYVLPPFLVCSLLMIRVLGRKVMTEDEMIAADSKVGTGVAEVRRMMRGSGQFTPSRFAT